MGAEDQIVVAQIRAVPRKGDLDANHATVMSVLAGIEDDVDVVVTPECFLDGYVSTESAVTRETIGEYAIDPESSPGQISAERKHSRPRPDDSNSSSRPATAVSGLVSSRRIFRTGRPTGRHR